MLGVRDSSSHSYSINRFLIEEARASYRLLTIMKLPNKEKKKKQKEKKIKQLHITQQILNLSLLKTGG